MRHRITESIDVSPVESLKAPQRTIRRDRLRLPVPPPLPATTNDGKATDFDCYNKYYALLFNPTSKLIIFARLAGVRERWTRVETVRAGSRQRLLSWGQCRVRTPTASTTRACRWSSSARGRRWPATVARVDLGATSSSDTTAATRRDTASRPPTLSPAILCRRRRSPPTKSPLLTSTRTLSTTTRGASCITGANC